MRSVACVECSQSFPFGETYEVLGRTMCAECGEKVLSEHGADNLAEGDLVRNVDPTVCVWCNNDAGAQEHERLIADQPTCEPCNLRMRNWPYPAWVKLSFVLLVVVAIVAFVHNYRFVDAVVSIRQANRALRNGNAARAADLWENAARRVPEEKHLAALADLHRGVALLAADQPDEAVAKLQNYVQLVPQDHDGRLMLLRAEVAAAFDHRDYVTMLQKAQEMQAAMPGDGLAAMQVASSAACVYAANGDAAQKALAEQWLQKSRDLGFQGQEADEYEDRIRHRLATRQIVKRADFEQQFPNGWKGGQQ